MKLDKLINTNLDIDIKGITDDSRLVQEGYLFVATKGYNVDHYDYVEDAINNGCNFIVCDREIKYNIPHIIVDNLDEYYRELCKKFYNIDPNELRLIGVTGTDGKTTTTTLVKELLKDCAYLGTNGLTIGDKTISTSNTTPCISELYRDLGLVKENRINTVSMEVSSEALLHKRVEGFSFDIVAFTNVTGDHLNVHKTFKNYLDCKLQLLSYLKTDGLVIVNGDDPSLKDIKNAITFGFNKDNDYVIEEVKYNKLTKITITNKNNKYILESPLKGKYNVYNMSLAFIICLLYGVDSDTLIKRIKKIKPISGRCEFLDFGQDYDIVLDYAHTINGIKSILEAFKDYNYNRIITVTGCAGGREKEKRPIIGKMVIDNSNIAIFTMDDPRKESVDEIIDQMVGEEKDYIRIIDREEAIHYAFDIANQNDVVLILGKGRDNYMAIGDTKIEYNDYETICKYFE
ncbi:MAG: UDP-N-acetylmuramoyl-L-alanyl-D-glutamate--2,6-diaminopimelate ligase [Bacilli bacterium]|nr:UDP-N-acetylmuramoyl-L-alanyl-D-glutamate--2,6-diaminopimelate ligase [Bacilli bacterium]